MNASRAERIGAERRRSQNIRERYRPAGYTHLTFCANTHTAPALDLDPGQKKSKYEKLFLKKGIFFCAGQRRRKKKMQ